MAKKPDLIETWSIDSPLEEFEDVHVVYGEPSDGKVPQPVSPSTRNGKAKTIPSKRKKAKSRRRGS
jgi:hypothetical protein